MSFLAGLRPPSNPIDSGKTEEIKRITERVLSRFTKNYLMCLKDVLIENAELKLAKELKKKEKEAKKASKGPSEPKPVRPRGKPEKKNKDQVEAKVVSFETLDSDVDPYVSYIIVASYKGREATKSRRYKEFKILHKKLGKLVPPGAKVPPASSSFGARNLSNEFLQDRRKTLSDYLKQLCKVEALKKNADWLKFLGLVKPEDPVQDEIFARALERTKWDLWIWKKILYDEPGEAIAKLIVEEIKREMWHDICHACPPVEAVRRQALKIAYRTISALVTPPVSTAWGKMMDISKPLRAKVVDLLGQQFDKIVQVKHEIKTKLKQGMAAVLNPVVELMSKLLGNVLRALIPPMVQGLQPVIEKGSSMNQTITEAIQNGDADKCKQLGDTLTELKNSVYQRINEALAKSLEGLLGDLSKEITLDVLKTFLSPVAKVINIVESLCTLFDPNNYMEVIVHLIKEKDGIIQADPGKPEDIEHKLDWEEWEALWKIRWKGYGIRSAGRSLWWDLSTLLVDLGPVPDIFWELSKDIQKYLHHRPLKKFSWKFGDYLHGALINPADTREWKVKVNESFIIGYQRALKCARKQLGIVLLRYASEFVKKPVLGPIEKEIIPKIEDVIKPLESLIPEPLAEILDISGMVTSSIIETISEACDRIVSEQVPVVSEELVKLGVH